MDLKSAFNRYKKEIILIVVVAVLIGALIQYAGKMPSFITDFFNKILKKDVK